MARRFAAEPQWLCNENIKYSKEQYGVLTFLKDFIAHKIVIPGPNNVRRNCIDYLVELNTHNQNSDRIESGSIYGVHHRPTLYMY